MEHGYYWLQIDDQEPEVVEIDGDSMYRCGSDVTCRLDGGRWIEFGEALDIVAIIGPLIPTDGRMFITEYLLLGDDEVSIVRHPLSEWPEWASTLRELMTPNATLSGSDAAGGRSA